MGLEVKKIFLLFYMCQLALALTRCYEHLYSPHVVAKKGNKCVSKTLRDFPRLTKNIA